MRKTGKRYYGQYPFLIDRDMVRLAVWVTLLTAAFVIVYSLLTGHSN